MKEKFNQMFKDKVFLVMLVLGLLTIVAAAGVVTIQRGNGQQENPYVDMQGQEGLLAENQEQPPVAGESNAQAADPQGGTELAGEGALPEEGYQTADGADGSLTDGSDAGTGAEGMAVADAGEAGSAGGTDPADGASGADTLAGADAEAAGTGVDAAKALMLDFSDTSKMMWPVRGNIVLDYSMDSTIYFPTLDQYKCNPGLVIQGAVSDPVYAPANARVLEVGINEEIGNYLTLDLGNGYTAICGQLKEVAAAAGEYLERGQLLGYVAEPTKYYTVEGSNVFLEMKHENRTVDPLDYME
ncbi:MAG: peptidoglycan DD-metalloendopeptidase family protein [Eubacteriales bacterium]|nr:peptidoglycan DD-metalloendopeptidase family protein [Eubacteriales bacterium]